MNAAVSVLSNAWGRQYPSGMSCWTNLARTTCSGIGRTKYFWGKEIIPCGVQSARFRAQGFNSSDRAPSIGFRPVLEPLLPAATDLSGQEGKKIRLHGPDNTIIAGTLVSSDDYDVIVDGVKIGKCDWAIGDDKGIVAIRSKILWIKKDYR